MHVLTAYIILSNRIEKQLMQERINHFNYSMLLRSMLCHPMLQCNFNTNPSKTVYRLQKCNKASGAGDDPSHRKLDVRGITSTRERARRRRSTRLRHGRIAGFACRCGAQGARHTRQHGRWRRRHFHRASARRSHRRLRRRARHLHRAAHAAPAAGAHYRTAWIDAHA